MLTMCGMRCWVPALQSSQGGLLVLDPPCMLPMHELALCSLHETCICVLEYLFALTIPCTCEGKTAAEVLVYI